MYKEFSVLFFHATNSLLCFEENMKNESTFFRKLRLCCIIMWWHLQSSTFVWLRVFCISIPWVYEVQCFNPNQAGLFGQSTGGGGGICPKNFLSFYGPIFHPNQSKHGLKWNLAPSYTYKNFEQHPMNRSFSVRPRQSDLVWRWNFWDFDMQIFEKW